jgi:hypothetical protein
MRTLFIALAVAPLCGCAGAHERTTALTENTNARGAPAAPIRTLEIELLALDLDTCGRCTRTDRNLEDAIDSAAHLFREAGVEVRVAKRVIRSAEEAIRHRFASSPTIRIDGRDIALELRESSCGECGELCGGGAGSVDCRVWVWRGEEHLEAPRAMIVDAMLRAYGGGGSAPAGGSEFRLPENLAAFFAAAARMRTAGAGCCEGAADCCAGAAECCEGSTECCGGAAGGASKVAEARAGACCAD